MAENTGTTGNTFGYEFLRDYLYLDIDKVRSIAGQLEFGIPEESRRLDTKKRRFSLGWEKLVSLGNEVTDENYLQRSMVDSLFPELESALEAGWLIDITDTFEGGQRQFDTIKNLRPEGSIFRLTAPGILFDFEYFSETLANFSSAMGGYQSFAKSMQASSQKISSDLQRAGKKPSPAKIENSLKYRSIPQDPTTEDLIEEFAAAGEVSSSFLRSISRLTRGISRPGMSLIMESGTSDDSLVMAARFQQNRRYFDADSSIIASRFGLSKQNWTIVGTIGHYTLPLTDVQAANQLINVRGAQGPEGTFSRKYFIDMMSSLIQVFGANGLSDIPQHPSISVIPIAVYRSFERIS